MSSPSHQPLRADPVAPLPPEWVDRLFGKLAVRYGHEWLRMWEGLDMAAVKADWAQVLAGMARPERVDALRYGVEHLPPERPPTAAVFKALCNRAPDHKPLALPSPPPTPEGVAKVRALLAEIAPPADPRAWAKTLIERKKAGEWVSSKALEMARSALAAKPGEMAS
jgi:hypothetical protein